MVFRLEQIQKQTQKLMLTPQMLQSIDILQLPLMELRNEIINEITNNPVLEEVSDRSAEDISFDEGRDSAIEYEELNFKEEFDTLMQLDDEWKEYFKQSGSFRKFSEEDKAKRKFFEDSIHTEETLQEHLLNQASFSIRYEHEIAIAEIIIGNLDENGYLQAGIPSIAKQCKTEEDKVLSVLNIIQTFHPVGVGARDVKECLLIQLGRINKIDEVAEAVIVRFFDDLAKKKIDYIAKQLNIPQEEVIKAAQLISTLDPKPGRLFASIDKSHYLIPDVIIEKVNGEYQIIINDDKMPHITISNFYKRLLKDENVNPGTQEYIRSQIKGGLWLKKNIHLRQQTISRITEELVKEQKAFFDDGIQHLKPLTMQQIAENLHLHESTVSRAIANKNIQTHHGLFQMKYFFTTGILTDAGDTISTRNVKEKIKNIVDNEDGKNPYSDSEIVQLLAKEGIAIARRTVAKYRKELHILPSNMRKKLST